MFRTRSFNHKMSVKVISLIILSMTFLGNVTGVINNTKIGIDITILNLSSVVLNSLITGKLLSNLNNEELSVLYHISKTSSFKCVNLNPDLYESMITSDLNLRLDYPGNDIEYSDIYRSKIMKCLIPSGQSYDIVPANMISEVLFKTIRLTIDYYIGTIVVGKASYNDSDSWSNEIYYLEKGAVDKIRLRLDELGKESLTLDLLNNWFRRDLEIVKSPKDLSNEFIGIRKSGIESLIIGYVREYESIRCESWIELSRLYKSVCQTLLYMKIRSGTLTKRAYFLYSYDNIYSNFDRDLDKCLTLAGHSHDLELRLLQLNKIYDSGTIGDISMVVDEKDRLMIRRLEKLNYDILRNYNLDYIFRYMRLFSSDRGNGDLSDVDSIIEYLRPDRNVCN